MSEGSAIIETMFDTTSHTPGTSLTVPMTQALDGLVSSLVEIRKGIAAFQALEAEMFTAALALGLEHADGTRGDGDLAVREVAAEIGAALRISDRTVQRQLDSAHELTTKFSATHDSLTHGAISRAHAGVIVDAGAHLHDAEAREEYQRQVLPVAARESASRLKVVARLAAERLAPRTPQERHRAAAEHRTVWVRDLDDGMGELCFYGSAVLTHGMHDRLTSMARAVADAERTDPACATATLAASAAESTAGSTAQEPGESPPQADPVRGDAGVRRTMDQLRADLLADLILTGAPSVAPEGNPLDAITAEVFVTVPVLTLAGASDTPAVLDGRQPIDTATATRLVGAASGWNRVLTDPVTGTVLETDRYRPSAQLRRLLRATDQRCRFPACMMPAHRCDIDHLHDAAHGGATHHGNLATECRRHHVLKHHSAWRVRPGPDRTLLWTSPTGRTYPDRVMPHAVAFADPDPPPY